MDSRKVTLKLTRRAALYVQKDTPFEVRLAAARAATPLPVHELVPVLFYLYRTGDRTLRSVIRETMSDLPLSGLRQLLDSVDTPSVLLDFLAHTRGHDLDVFDRIIQHPNVETPTLVRLAHQVSEEGLIRFAEQDGCLVRHPEVATIVLKDGRLPAHMRQRLGALFGEAEAEDIGTPAETVLDKAADSGESLVSGVDLNGVVLPSFVTGGGEYSHEERPIEDVDDAKLSKYQQALTLGVNDKIKIAMTGDKEWRKILIADNNKMVQAAVMRNPRITDGEILAIANNKSSNEELIRLILLNREWMKNYEIKKAVLLHTRTPLATALRLLSSLTERDLAKIAKSRNVTQALAVNARKLVEAKRQKGT